MALSALSLLFIAPVSFAKDSKEETPKRVVVASGETVEKDYFAFGDSAEISGTINGDLYAFAGQVLIDGKVNGDVIAAGGTVTISGQVSQDVRVAGGQVSISGKLGRNLTVGGGNVDLTGESEVSGGVVAGAGNLSLAGSIAKDVYLGAGNVTISNSVGGDINAGTGQLRLTSKAKVGGSITYWSDRDLSLDSNAKVAGTVSKKTFPARTQVSTEKVLGVLAGVNLFLKIISFVSILILGFLLLHFFPKFADETVATLKARPLASLGFGLLALILTPIAFVLLLISIVGIPLALILLALYLISLFVVRIFVVYWAGQALLNQGGRQAGRFLTFFLGLVVFTIISFVPIVSGIVAFFVLLFGLGAVLLTLQKNYSSAKTLSAGK